MYTIHLGGEIIGTTMLETGDPPMGVASGTVEFVWSPMQVESNLRQRGALDESGVLVVKDRPDLLVMDENSAIVGGQFCYLEYAVELNHGHVAVCGIDHREYRERFPAQSEQYWGSEANN